MDVKTKELGPVGGRAPENFVCRSANELCKRFFFFYFLNDDTPSLCFSKHGHGPNPRGIVVFSIFMYSH